MTRLLFREDAYLTEAPARALSATPEGGLVLDATLFYPTGGGQPGDSGWLDWDGGSVAIATTVKGEGGTVVLVPAEPGALPPPGAEVLQRLDWPRRYLHMRVHTALHLLSVALPFPVTGGQIGAGRGRLDFHLPEPVRDPDALEARLAAMVDADLRVSERLISEAELAARPGLVKTRHALPPRGAGAVRLVQIGDDPEPLDLQPCGGTHVARTSEIGALRLGRIESKGRENRRVSLALETG